MQGANYDYVQGLFEELLQQIQQTNRPNLAEYLSKRNDIRQGNENKINLYFHQDAFWHRKDRNGHDCGVAVISIIKRIITLAINQSWRNKLKYGNFHLGDD